MFVVRAFRLTRRGEPCELALQQVDLCKVAARIVIAASLADSESKPAARVRVVNAARVLRASAASGWWKHARRRANQLLPPLAKVTRLVQLRSRNGYFNPSTRNNVI
jgi:hypothetical protein